MLYLYNFVIIDIYTNLFVKISQQGIYIILLVKVGQSLTVTRKTNRGDRTDKYFLFGYLLNFFSKMCTPHSFSLKAITMLWSDEVIKKFGTTLLCQYLVVVF